MTADTRVATNGFIFQKGWKDGLVRCMHEGPSPEPQLEELGTDGSLGLSANLAESMSSVRDPHLKKKKAQSRNTDDRTLCVHAHT